MHDASFTITVIVVEAPAVADLQIVKADDPDLVTTEEDLTYTLTVTNNGPGDATEVSLTDTLPTEVIFVSATPSQGSCSEAAGIVTCDLGSIANGDSVEVTIVVTPTAGGTITDSATVAADQEDPDASNNAVTEETEVILIVPIDIKPGDDDDDDDGDGLTTINLGSRGTTPVAILSTATFDATTVNPTTVTPAGAPVKLRRNGRPMASFEDVNRDRLEDLVVHVETRALQLSGAVVEAVLEGQAFAGIRIKGVETVRIVPVPAPSSLTSTYPTFSWGEVTGAICYQIQIDNHRRFRSPEQDATVVGGTQYNADPLPNGQYYWRVRVGGRCAGVHSGEWSAPETFIVDGAPPIISAQIASTEDASSIAAQSPADAVPVLRQFTLFTITSPTLSWELVTWSTGYEIQIDNYLNFSSPEYINNDIPATLRGDRIAPLSDGTWYWRVRARREDGSWGAWSDMGNFTIGLRRG